MSAVGERIRKLREERGLSPEEFAKAVGLTTSRLEEIEEGRIEPCEATLVYISRIFGVDYRYLREGRERLTPSAEPVPS